MAGLGSDPSIYVEKLGAGGHIRDVKSRKPLTYCARRRD